MEEILQQKIGKVTAHYSFGNIDISTKKNINEQTQLFSFWAMINQYIKIARLILSMWYRGVSKNRGTPKWMVYNGKPLLQRSFNINKATNSNSFVFSWNLSRNVGATHLTVGFLSPGVGAGTCRLFCRWLRMTTKTTRDCTILSWKHQHLPVGVNWLFGVTVVIAQYVKKRGHSLRSLLLRPMRPW